MKPNALKLAAGLALMLGLAAGEAMPHEHGGEPVGERRFDGHRRDMAPVHQEKRREHEERLEQEERQKQECEQERGDADACAEMADDGA